MFSFDKKTKMALDTSVGTRSSKSSQSRSSDATSPTTFIRESLVESDSSGCFQCPDLVADAPLPSSEEPLSVAVSERLVEQKEESEHRKTPTRESKYFRVGREFYDDQYFDEEKESQSIQAATPMIYENGDDESEVSIPDQLDLRSFIPKGMNEAMDQLKELWNTRVLNADGSQERFSSAAVFVRGQSGAGKSTLVEEFLAKISNEETRSHTPLILRGKFSGLQGTDPMSAFIDAFEKLGEEMSAIDTSQDTASKRQLETLQSRLAKDIDSESAAIIVALIPSLQVLFPRGSRKQPGSEGNGSADGGSKPANQKSTCSNQNAINQLKFAFPKFCNSISTKENPLVLFVDDLHWIDASSSILLQSLLTDGQLQFCMFVGTYRSDEAESDSELAKALNIVQETRSVSFLDVKNFSYEEQAHFIAGVLRVDDQVTVSELNDLVYSKTFGNVLFTKQILEQLFREGLLEFSRLTFQWEWHLHDEAALDDVLSKDVVETILAKIRAQSLQIQEIMKIAAYTRSSTIDVRTLHILYLHLLETPFESPEKKKIQSLEFPKFLKVLDKSVHDGLLSNEGGSSMYSFAHDRIQQASYALIPIGPERDAFVLRMGKLLLRLYDEMGGHSGNSRTWMIYAAADHLNSVTFSYHLKQEHVKGGNKLQLMRLNLRVGEMAASRAAFSTASKYLQNALKEFEHQASACIWTKDYDMALRLYQVYTNVELSQGNFDSGRRLAEEVMNHARIVEDTMHTRLSLAKACERENDHVKSIEVSEEALRIINMYPLCRFSLSCGLIRNFSYVLRYLQRHTDEDIISLPLQENELRLTGMDLLVVSAHQAYYTGDTVKFLADTLYIIRYSLLNGICGQTGTALASFSLVLNRMGDANTTWRLLALAERIFSMTNVKSGRYILPVCQFHLTAWKDSLGQSLDRLEKAVQLCMETGEFGRGLTFRVMSVHLQYYSGHPLGNLDEELADILERARFYRVDDAACLATELRRKIQHLMNVVDPLFDAKRLPDLDCNGQARSEKHLMLHGYLTRTELGFYFRDVAFAKSMAKNLISISKEVGESFPVDCLELFFASLAYSSRALVTEKISHRSKARKYCNQLRNLCETRGKNSWHRVLVMKANLELMNKKADKATIESLFDAAIRTSRETGHIQDVGLSCQLVGEYFGREHDSYKAKKYLKMAREAFSEWGANALVRHLETRHPTYFVEEAAPAKAEIKII